MPTVEYDLKDILTRIDTKLDRLSEDVNEVKVDIAAIKTELTQVQKDISELKGSQKTQIWSLIVLAFTAVLGLIGALTKVLLFPTVQF